MQSSGTSGTAGSDPEATQTGRLLERAQAGDVAAEQRVYQVHRERLAVRVRRHPLRGAAASLCSDDDLVQDVFVRVFASGLLQRFDDRGPGSLDRLLGTVLDRVLTDTLRRGSAVKRKPAQPILSLSADDDALAALAPPSSQPSPTSEARAAELRQTAKAVLDERQWAVWSAIEIAGLNAADVAELLGTTPSAVRGVLARARRVLIGASVDEGRRPLPGHVG